MSGRVTLLSGGVGGAKLALGFASILEPRRLAVIANTGDDLELFGLRISPDCDILVYTLAGRVNPATGWGIEGDSFRALEMVEALGGTGWFRLGDRDLGVHLFRTELLRRGVGLGEVTARIAAGMGISVTVLPMCEAPVSTQIATAEGELHLQEYLVRDKAAPPVRGVHYAGIEGAVPAPGVAEALAESILVVVAPSNPFLSIGPILAVPGMGELLRGSPALRVGVSSIVGGRALKGPAAKMLAELGYPVSAVTVARMWAEWLDVFVVDECDAGHAQEIEALGLRCLAVPTVMTTMDDKKVLAARLLALARGGR